MLEIALEIIFLVFGISCLVLVGMVLAGEIREKLQRKRLIQREYDFFLAPASSPEREILLSLIRRHGIKEVSKALPHLLCDSKKAK